MPDCKKKKKNLPILNRSITMRHFLACTFLDFHLLKEISQWNKAPPCISSSHPYSPVLTLLHEFCFKILSKERLMDSPPQ